MHVHETFPGAVCFHELSAGSAMRRRLRGRREARQNGSPPGHGRSHAVMRLTIVADDAIEKENPPSRKAGRVFEVCS
jgi:hypothetical protein